MSFWNRLWKPRPTPENLRQTLRSLLDFKFDFNDREELLKLDAQRNELEARLVSGGRHTVPLLLTALPDDRPSTLGEILQKIGTPGLEGLVEFLKVQTDRNRIRGLEALGKFGPEAATQLPFVTTFLGAQDSGVRAAAMHAVALMGSSCSTVLPELLKGIKDPDAQVRRAACFALEQAELREDEIRAALVPLLSDPDDGVRQSALASLHALFPAKLPESIPGLLQDRNKRVAWNLIEWIGETPSPPASAIDAVRACLGNPELELFAAKTLWTATKRAEEILPTVLRHLSPEKRCSPKTACDLITKIGPAASEAVPRLVSLLQQKDYDGLWAAADALAAIGRAAEPAIPALAALLEHPSGTVGASAAHALAEIGRPAFPEVFTVLKSGSPRAQEFAADCLGRLGEAAREALPSLERLLEKTQGQPEFRAWLLLAIGEIDPARAGPERLSALLHPGLASDMRKRAAEALRRIGT